MAESALDLFAMAAALADDDESDGEGDGDQGAAEDGETRASAEALRKQLETFLEEGTKEKAAERVHFGDLELRDASELAPEEFERDFLAPGRPLALLGCADAWESRSWTAASLGDTYGDASFALYTGQKFTLREYLSYAEGRAEIDECPLYLFEDLSVRADAADAKSAAARDAILAGNDMTSFGAVRASNTGQSAFLASFTTFG
ncbi:Bifunctional arginine demethylase and lysyl-hydroxylase JMJD6 [Hondaea fermentalgiana]|uniref:Bifunctional arginine demethylase and lysyl-hydroxylase JMJD6 n=1 Tax=Hondaea fermentalgiana TaxID=2315210 RepID=A0A2R5H0K7_9STRA|nr:Bifunctional arginine demethylase and lysyl-hydroxylase JMJD6 [Hondaea fermentalgiana]|eukprot:GBG34593.1 Bifunctional arginine demethylase and lysyl-hydroxylase JMJD6 [Hondaea fermentalgiana]